LNPSTMVSGKHPAKSAKRLNRGRWAFKVFSVNKFTKTYCQRFERRR
jgi:hypothetical protein